MEPTRPESLKLPAKVERVYRCCGSLFVSPMRRAELVGLCLSAVRKRDFRLKEGSDLNTVSSEEAVLAGTPISNVR